MYTLAPTSTKLLGFEISIQSKECPEFAIKELYALKNRLSLLLKPTIQM